jgi:putative ABC transport system ATP-binding protein
VTGIKVLELLKGINRDLGKTVIVITHNQPIAQMADRVIKMRSGEVTDIHINSSPASPQDIVW